MLSNNLRARNTIVGPTSLLPCLIHSAPKQNTAAVGFKRRHQSDLRSRIVLSGHPRTHEEFVKLSRLVIYFGPRSNAQAVLWYNNVISLRDKPPGQRLATNFMINGQIATVIKSQLVPQKLRGVTAVL